MNDQSVIISFFVYFARLNLLTRDGTSLVKLTYVHFVRPVVNGGEANRRPETTVMGEIKNSAITERRTDHGWIPTTVQLEQFTT